MRISGQATSCGAERELVPSGMFDIELSNVRVEVPTREGARTLFAFPRLSIPQGEHLHIHGASGSGKTTLLHMISGLFVPAQGSIGVGSTRLDHLSDGGRAAFRRRHVGVIFQKLNLLEFLTVHENIRLGGADSPHLIQAAIERVGLGERSGDLCSVLSLGEQQRVAVARILAFRPDIILADEPTSSLDEDNARVVIDALVECAQGKTLVVVSHDERLRSRLRKTVDFRELVGRA